MIKILAADIGFRSTGMAIFRFTAWGWELFDTKCVHTNQAHTVRIIKNGRRVKRRTDSVVCDDIRRTEFLATEISNYFITNQCSFMACELPHGGAQSAQAQKAMSAAVTMIAVVRLFLQCGWQQVTPNESRAAAGWDKGAHAIPPGLSKQEHKQALTSRTKELKAFVMSAMSEKYPIITGLPVVDKEHIADALATFEHARNCDSIKELENDAT